jgi:hypothetical protein
MDFQAVGSAVLRCVAGRDASDGLTAGQIGDELFGGR